MSAPLPYNKKPSANRRQPLYQLLSLDILAGSMAVGLFATLIFEVTPNLLWWAVLPLAVWTVYTLDHLLDGMRKGGKSAIYRHRFHYQYRKILIPCLVLTGILTLVLSYLYLNPLIVRYGLMLSGLVLLYFIVVYFQPRLKIKYIHKEVFIAVVYVAGILLAPVVWYGGRVIVQHLLLFGTLTVLAWAESVMVSFFDFHHDRADRLKSFATVYGLKKTRNTLIYVHLLVAAILFFSVLFCNNKTMLGAIIILSVMNLILLAMIWQPKAFTGNNLYRWIGEAVFVLPAAIVLF